MARLRKTAARAPSARGRRAGLHGCGYARPCRARFLPAATWRRARRWRAFSRKKRNSPGRPIRSGSFCGFRIARKGCVAVVGRVGCGGLAGGLAAIPQKAAGRKARATQSGSAHIPGGTAQRFAGALVNRLIHFYDGGKGDRGRQFTATLMALSLKGFVAMRAAGDDDIALALKGMSGQALPHEKALYRMLEEAADGAGEISLNALRQAHCGRAAVERGAPRNVRAGGGRGF